MAAPAQITDRVCRAIDTLIEVSDGCGGLFPSIIDRTSTEMLAHLPAGIQGQRDGDQRLLEWAETVGRYYLREPFPRELAVPAMDTGMGLGLLADLYELTGCDAWLDGGLGRTEQILELYFGDGDLPAGASSIDWYESQMGPSFLIHGLARLALLAAHGRDCPLQPDYTGR